LVSGDVRGAIALCRRVSATAEVPRLAAWGLSCSARAYRLLGDLESAAGALDQALVYHEYATPELLGQRIALGPGQRADDFYRAARIAVEQGRPEGAWTILQRLDGLLAGERARRACSGVEAEEAGQTRRRLLLQLLALDGPASRSRRRQRASIRRALMQRLQELARQQSPCSESLIPGSDAGVRFRAVPLEDEILLLERTDGGQVVTYRRTPFERKRLVALARDVARFLESRGNDVEEWRHLVGPLARALVPRAKDLDDVTTFALHGVLQEIPLEALPLPGGERQPWLGDATTIVYRPAGAVSRRVDTVGQAFHPVFIVDPSGNLAGGDALAEIYGSFGSGVRLLERDGATRSALQDALSGASWLHVDAHAWYDPAFPELSSLLLADGPLTIGELARMPQSLTFANLSACGTGRWPVTADSGRFGMAGALARGGVPWVVGSRADLSDELAADFNRALYEGLERGQGVVEAYGEAMRSVRKSHPVSRWAAILLVGGAPGAGFEKEGGKAPEQ